MLKSIGVVFAVLVALGLIVVLTFVIPAFFRYQAIQSAQNKVRVTEIEIHNTEQLIVVESKKAKVRVEEAKGIAESQKIINATLTDKYLMHEAIKAQEQMVKSNAHTQIYIPSGQMGLPLVKTVDGDK